MATTPTIVNVYPANDSKGVVIGDKIIVLFDQAMDEESINSGSLVLAGPTKDYIFGQDFNVLDEPGIEDEQILNSPYTGAYVEGTFSFRRISMSGLDEVDVEDVNGEGDLYRTEVTFTPSQPLRPNVVYNVLLAGDETPDDDYDIGIRTRTVFDTDPTITGDGTLTFGGGYSGELEKTYIIEITSGGPTGQAEYIWWDDSTPLDVFPGITSTGRRQITDGLWVSCDPDGNFNTGDLFSVKCIPPVVLENNYNWSFETGSGSILVPPSSSSTSGIVDISTENSLTNGSDFTVSVVDPASRSYSIPTTRQDIIITFSEEPDSATVITDNFTVVAEPVNGDTSILANGDLSFSLAQNSNVVTLTLDPEQLLQNNIIKITISSNVKNISGDSISEYCWYFTTEYNPTYTSIRRIRFDLGPLVANVPNETIMFAIFEASLYVDAICFAAPSAQSANFLNYAKREMATCLAELMLLSGSQGFGPGDSLSKTLGDLAVKRSDGGRSANDKLDELRECIAKWEPVIQSGGQLSPYTSLKPGHTVKGSTSEDAMIASRTWEPTSYPGNSTTSASAANTKTPITSRRWVRNFRKRS